MSVAANPFLKYGSKSEKAYYQFTNLFNLKPLDVLVMWYLMHMYQKSTYHGKKGKGGKCFYRNDRKFTGYYIGGHYKNMAEQVPAKTSPESVKKSVSRLQAKGLLYHHRSINNVQIYLPIFDEDVRQSFNDPDYKTVINFDEIYKGKKDLSAKVKKNFALVSKRSLRKYQKDLCNNVPLNNEPKTNEPLNNVVVSSFNREATNNKQQQKPKAKQKLPKWINNNLNQSIANLLIEYTKNVSKVATNIIDIIFSINRNYFNIMSSSYYRNKTNPYIQNGGLVKSLKAVFNDHKDLKKTVTNDYQNYIDANSNLKLKNSKKPKNNGLAYTGNDKSVNDKVREAENKIDLLNKGKQHAKTNNDKHKIQDQIQKYAHYICNHSDDEMWAIKGTNESKPHLHPTSPAMNKKLQRQLKDLDKHNAEHYIDANGTEHVTVHHKAFMPKSKLNTVDMDEIEKELESNNTGKESETVPPSNDQKTGTDDDYNPF